ncbi:ATP-dependent DNA helicase RecG [Bifidobacterium sp. 82T24]|uniref:ATP-dependent DNA helicase RecG n=1 Tax=Bifidobacterium pluvialisilvae TaxID=2834436 RepID=UPI001C58AE04|nr:ATP-dependent DNA helicase RecG [Bifidobacterium pluvialisilvae]MBW3088983.1 ATP-dependent DNA helicase RecG [Bifidobacterium pluvialisilvae]
MTIALDTAVSSLMTNKRRVGALKSLGVVTVGDALTYYPFRVTDPVPVTPIRSITIGVKAAFVATVRELRVMPMNARRGFRVEAVLDDADFVGPSPRTALTEPSSSFADTNAAARYAHTAPGMARLVFFSHNKGYADWMSSRLRADSVVVIAGDPTVFNNNLQFTHPDVVVVYGPDGRPAEIDSVAAALAKVSRPQPVYHASSRISTDHIHESILGFLHMMADDAAGEAASDTASDTDGGTASVPAAPMPPSVPASAPGAVPATPVDPASLARAIPDILPESVRTGERLMHRAEAFLAIHHPDSVKRFHAGIRTMRFEEAFVAQTALLAVRRQATTIDAYPCPQPTGMDVFDVDAGETRLQKFIKSLPFQLTDGQRKVIDDIAADMTKPAPMQRLLQGEVGSGKTVVAVAAMLQAVDAGHQAVLVAPTQVLAEQHYASINRMVGGDVDVLLLTGGMKLAARRRVLGTAASGTPCIVVATHAAFSKSFQAPNLALAVIDEQHRFGVEQRETLRRKSERAPHLLVMTATPIPRTAAMTWFGDLDISWLTELPGGRKPIRTIVVPEADGHTMARMFAHIRARVDAGERAYIVCPRIDENPEDEETAAEIAVEGGGARGGRRRSGAKSSRMMARRSSRRDEEYGLMIDDPFDDPSDAGDGSATPKPPLHSVEEIAARLAALPQFQGIELATLTGRDDDETKRRVMDDFSSGCTPVLVATTVIEVGVDVPQASCIVIFDADRFGLSQLHQLRGRVGRGGTNSWAFLISRAEPGSLAAQRLEVIRTSTDGADIAQADIELRGAGDVLGDAQSGGRSSLKLLRVVKDADMIADARKRAQALLDADPDLHGEVELAGAVLDFTRGNEQFITST